MKNSNGTSVKSVAIDVVKTIVYPAHLACQTAADLLNIAQANIIKAIDGTELNESMMAQETWSRNQQAKVVEKYLEVQERIEKRKEAARQAHIEKLHKAIDIAEGVEDVTTEPIAKAPAVPSPPVDAPFVPINKREPKAKDVPTMTTKEAFEPAV